MAVPCRSACAAHSLEPPHHHAADALVLLMQYTAAAVYMRQLGTSTGQCLSMTIALRAERRCRRSLVALDVLGAWFRTRRMPGVAHRLRRQRDLPNPVCCKPAFYLLETTRSRQSRVRCHANHSTASPRLGGGTSHRSGRGLRLAGSGTTFPVRSVSAVVQQASNFLRTRVRLGARLWQAQSETGASPTSRDITPIPLPVSSSSGPSQIRTRPPRSPSVSMVGRTSTSS
jgi:hypothetical protein